MESGNQSGNNKNNKGLFPPILNSMMNRASGASQIIQDEENNRLQQLNQASSASANTSRNNNMVSGASALSTNRQANNMLEQNRINNRNSNMATQPQMANSRVSSPRRTSSQPRTSSNSSRNSMSSATREFDNKMANSSIPMNNSIGGGAMLSATNEVGPKELNGLVDVIMTSDMDRPVKRQLLKVILNNIKTITDREDKEIDDMRDKYTAGAYMSSLMPQVQMMPPAQPNPYAMPGMGMQPTNPYMMPGMGMPQPYPYMMPGIGNLAMPYYMGAQQPNMQVEMLGNKINVLQMEMADLTRHLKDYTRRYMDVMREDDMQRIKTYIEELSNVKETVEEAKGLANTMGPTPEELAEEAESANKGLIDKASDTVKNGLATVTNAVNNIGSKLGLVKEPGANNNQAAPANNQPANSQSTNSNKPANNTPAANTQTPYNKPTDPAIGEPDSEGENMVDLSDYEVPTSEDEAEDERPSNTSVDNKASEDNLDAAIDQLNKASNEALSVKSQNSSAPANQPTGNKPANQSTGNKPANQSTGNTPTNQPAIHKPVNTANALSRAGNTMSKSPMTGGAVDSSFFKTFKKLLAKKGMTGQKTKKAK